MIRKARGTFRPGTDFLALMPPVSGNTVNGVGEASERRPTPIFWHKPEIETHGRLQEAIVQRFNEVPVLHAEFWAVEKRGPKRLPDVATQPVERSPETWAREVKAFAHAHEAELVGIVRIDPIWVYEGYPVPSEPWLVLVGVTMAHERISQAPATPDNPEGALVVAEEYNRSSRVARNVAAFIRGQGYRAQAHAGPWAGPLNLLPAAIAAGFGELGRHGSLINRRYGSSFRIAAVLTDLPLAADRPDAFGADDFCTRCQVCTDACPPDAISPLKQRVRGVEKWYVDFDRCIPYFNESYGCGICIAVCPWSTPGRAPRLAERWSERRGAQRRAEHKGAGADPPTSQPAPEA